METKRGGTKLHCSTCETATICAALPYDGGPQLQYFEEGDVWYFCRVRECQSCGNIFETYEVDGAWMRSFEWRLQMVKVDEKDVFMRAHGATQTVKSWNMELMLKIEAMERQLRDLRALHGKIDQITEAQDFLQISKV